jgi:tetratricopeptide (TPR) repeat protein
MNASSALARVGPIIARVLAVSLLATAVGCTDYTRGLPLIPSVETKGLEPSVIKAVERARAHFDSVAAKRPGRDRLGDAYGELAMIYHAQDLVAPAAVAYANAHTLAPDDKRWPYLLGHLYNDAARVPEAIASFEEVLAKHPTDAPTLLALGQIYLQTGALDKSEAMYERLKAQPGAQAAALAGLGKVALARRNYAVAVARLEEALKLVPEAARLRQPLAMAHQGQGDKEQAEAQIALFRADGYEPTVDDPLVDALSDKVAASRVLLRRGQREGKSGRFDLAEKAFRAAVAADPNDAEAIANLGISLANLGRIDEAQQRLEEALAKDDTIVVAHVSLGVVYDRKGRDAAAIEQYAKATRLDPANIPALVYQADALMRTGYATKAVPLYRDAAAKSPGSSRMEMSLAMALVRSGDLAQARDVLESAAKAQQDNYAIANALARLLATAPNVSLRNGARALELARKVFEATRSPEVGQTYAMALAETGNFTEAVKLQQETLIAYERSKLPVFRPALERNLQRYKRSEPAREGWAPEDPIFQPRSPAAQLVASASRPS